MKRHVWLSKAGNLGEYCRDCDCRRQYVYGIRGGYRARYHLNGKVQSKAPPCNLDTPLLVAVRAYIKQELPR